MDEAADGNNALEITHTVPFASGFKPFYEETTAGKAFTSMSLRF